MPDTILGMAINGSNLEKAAALTIGYFEHCIEKLEYQKLDIAITAFENL